MPSFLFEGAAFALVPRTTRLGFAAETWRPTPSETRDFSATVENAFAAPETIEAYVAEMTGRARPVAVDAFLCEVVVRACGPLLIGAD